LEDHTLFEELDIKIADAKITSLPSPITKLCTIGCTGTGHAGCKPIGSSTGSVCC
jgi:hypothetical protein